MKKEEIVVGIKEEGQYAIDLPMILQKSNKTKKKKK
jgi:predicted  nucleic acid-binding Zn-ribbon protein